jgi:hypothetical protein
MTVYLVFELIPTNGGAYGLSKDHKFEAAYASLESAKSHVESCRKPDYFPRELMAVRVWP